MLEGRSRLGIGWTRERFMSELRRLIRGKMGVLCRRKETSTAGGELKGTDGRVLAGWHDPSEDGFPMV
jgi:hypothetical protein